MNAKQMIPLWFLACCAFAVAPAIAQTITHVPAFTFRGEVLGESSFDAFGSAVSGAGDVNNDGFDDVIVGARNGDNNGRDSGSATVISGSDGSLLYQFTGNAAGDNFGRSVSGAGDVNGDGFDDLIVGGRFDDDGTASGSARVFSGSDGSLLYNFVGDSEGDIFGLSVSGAGDVNGDGFADVIVGSGRDDNGSNDSGIARVFSGFDGSVLYNFDGDSAGGGLAVSGAGDVNGDGFDDLIVGDSIDDTNGRLSGSAQVYSGSDGSLLYNFLGDSEFGRFGSSVSGAGDVNGDGLADLIVSAPRRRNPAIEPNFDTGNARVFSGADGSVLYNFDGSAAGDFFGRSVSGAGDVNGDGFDDLIVGAEIVSERGFGAVRVISGINGDVLYNFEGDSAFNRFGWSVSAAGDVNGDGLADFIAGDFKFGFENLGVTDGSGYARLFVSQITAPGDFNSDGDVDGDDVDFYIGNLGQPATGDLAQLDLNGDGNVTIADHDFHVTTLAVTSNGVTGALLGDVNLDGVVDILSDAFALVGSLGQSATSRSQGDLNADGVVDILNDAFILISQVGQPNAR